MDGIVVDILERVGVPLITLAGGWFGHVIRTKQKKEQELNTNTEEALQYGFSKGTAKSQKKGKSSKKGFNKI